MSWMAHALAGQKKQPNDGYEYWMVAIHGWKASISEMKNGVVNLVDQVNCKSKSSLSWWRCSGGSSCFA
jgi:hypothetical protein